MNSFSNEVIDSAKKKILFLPHAIDRMNEAKPVITTKEIREVIYNIEIIEDYPEDARGHSCLLLGFSSIYKRPIHVVCSPKKDYLAIITVYIPSLNKWKADYKTRKRG